MTFPSLLITALFVLNPLNEPVDNLPKDVDKRIERIITADRSRSEADCALKIAWRESRFQLHVRNPTSGAYGAFQLMQVDKHLNLQKQISRATKYVESRYGSTDKTHSWCKAWQAWQTKGWY
jgi:hypothetical protein